MAELDVAEDEYAIAFFDAENPDRHIVSDTTREIKP